MRLSGAVAAVLVLLALSACTDASQGTPDGEIIYVGDDEALLIFENCAGSTPHDIQVLYGGPPRLIDDSGAIVTPTNNEQTCLDRVAERFPARLPEEVAEAKAFVACLRFHNVEMPFQAIEVNHTRASPGVTVSYVEIPPEMFDLVADAVDACLLGE